LGKSTALDELPFQKVVRLEVSGIRQGDRNQIRARVKLKVEQVKLTNYLAPAYIVVIEFGQPLAWIVER